MTTAIRTVASVRSFYFRDAIAARTEAQLERYSLDDYRYLWRKSHAQAIEWRTRATTRIANARPQ